MRHYFATLIPDTSEDVLAKMTDGEAGYGRALCEKIPIFPNIIDTVIDRVNNDQRESRIGKDHSSYQITAIMHRLSCNKMELHLFKNT